MNRKIEKSLKVITKFLSSSKSKLQNDQNKMILENASSNNIASVLRNSQSETKNVWKGTETEFDTLAVKDPNVMYIIVEDN